jgi:hypothetical protein
MRHSVTAVPGAVPWMAWLEDDRQEIVASSYYRTREAAESAARGLRRPAAGKDGRRPAVETLTGGTVRVRPEGRDTSVLDVATFDTFDIERSTTMIETIRQMLADWNGATDEQRAVALASSARLAEAPPAMFAREEYIGVGQQAALELAIDELAVKGRAETPAPRPRQMPGQTELGEW